MDALSHTHKKKPQAHAAPLAVSTRVSPLPGPPSLPLPPPRFAPVIAPGPFPAVTPHPGQSRHSRTARLSRVRSRATREPPKPIATPRRCTVPLEGSERTLSPATFLPPSLSLPPTTKCLFAQASTAGPYANPRSAVPRAKREQTRAQTNATRHGARRRGAAMQPRTARRGATHSATECRAAGPRPLCHPLASARSPLPPPRLRAFPSTSISGAPPPSSFRSPSRPSPTDPPRPVPSIAASRPPITTAPLGRGASSATGPVRVEAPQRQRSPVSASPPPHPPPLPRPLPSTFASASPPFPDRASRRRRWRTTTDT